MGRRTSSASEGPPSAAGTPARRSAGRAAKAEAPPSATRRSARLSQRGSEAGVNVRDSAAEGTAAPPNRTLHLEPVPEEVSELHATPPLQRKAATGPGPTLGPEAAPVASAMRWRVRNAEPSAEPAAPAEPAVSSQKAARSGAAPACAAASAGASRQQDSNSTQPETAILESLAQQMWLALQAGPSDNESSDSDDDVCVHGGPSEPNGAGPSGWPGDEAASSSGSESGDTSNSGAKGRAAANSAGGHKGAGSEGGDELPAASLMDLTWAPDTQLPSGDIEGTLAQPPAVHVGKERGLAKQPRAPPRDSRMLARAAAAAAPDTAGARWFDLPATTITDDVKRDLRLLRLRHTYDPKRFYKSYDGGKFPKYFQFGTVVEGPADGAAGRLTRKQRKASIAEELLADEELAAARKRRYEAIQEEAQRWSRGANKRKGKGGKNARINKRAQRPKH